MAKKSKTPNPAKPCQCDKCGATDLSAIPGTKHRRCGGQANAPIRAKHSLPGARGVWR